MTGVAESETVSRKKILVFPAGMPRALAYMESARAEGQIIIGSSSLGYDPARERYALWVSLPYVNAPDFTDALRAAVDAHDIGGIYTPNPAIWDFLHKVLPARFPGVRLINPSPIETEMTPYRQALRFAETVGSGSLPVHSSAQPRAMASRTQIAALFRHAETIPGMCDHQKIRALCEIFRHAPEGDVVEIGSWWGKSAFILLRLAQIYETGKLLCIDPWSSEHLLQNDAEGMLDHIPVDTNEALTVFQLNLLPYGSEDLNFLRLPSVGGCAAYRKDHTVTSDAFGSTSYAGRISVLHIDGNHSYESAKADIDAWGDLVQPGGWIIFDDYVWPYGDGPQRVGDEFLEANRDRVEVAFVTGSALFIRMLA